jgi:predicted transposase
MAEKKAEKGDVLYLGVHARLVFPDPRDEEAVLDLMRRFSSATRYAYRRLLAGKPREELKRADGPLRKLFRLNTRYADGAIAKAKAVLDSALELGNDPKKVIFGGRGLFEQLKRKHLSGKDRERLKRRWKEKRRGLLYTRGDRSKKGGNPHFKLQVEGGGLWLLVHLGEEEGQRRGREEEVRPRPGEDLPPPAQRPPGADSHGTPLQRRAHAQGRQGLRPVHLERGASSSRPHQG